LERRKLHNSSQSIKWLCTELNDQKPKQGPDGKKKMHVAAVEDEQERKENQKNEKYLESKSLDDIKALEMQLDDLIEKRSFMLLSPNSKRILSDKESKINAERKQLKHDRKKEEEEMDGERRNKKNMENIQKLSEMMVFKGHPTMTRLAKQKVKKVDNSDKNKDGRDEDFKRYVMH
jgi:hypothetical protein